MPLLLPFEENCLDLSRALSTVAMEMQGGCRSEGIRDAQEVRR
jgi:hypothetical protein